VEQDLAASVSRLVLQLAVILVAAKLAAEATERWLRQPPVLGELAAGMLVGPYALGGLALPLLGPLFPPAPAGAGPGHLPVSPELYAIGQIAVVVLMFLAGLETDFGQFLRFGPAAGAVAAGGVVLPFALGAVATVALGLAASPGEPAALFMGAILTATSVGITARVLGDIGKLDTPEGVTILAAAVIDDVLGILVLAVVVGLATAGAVEPLQMGWIGLRALGLWLLLVAVSVALAGPLSRGILRFRADGALVPLALAAAFLGAAAAQAAGLALIIGAYSAGLAFSRVPAAGAMRDEVRPVYHLLVPIFFVVMGALVDFGAMAPVLVFGAVITLLAIVGKALGCGAAALAVGFNRLGALRVGIGMLPRGEVALIVAGVGLTSGAIAADLFGVAVMMTVVTTVLAPPLLVPAFRGGGPGWRGAAPAGRERRATERRRGADDRRGGRGDRRQPAVAPLGSTCVADAGPRYRLTLPAALAEAFAAHLIAALERDGWALVLTVEEPESGPVAELRRGDDVLSVRRRPAPAGTASVEVEGESKGWEPALAAAAEATARDVRAALVRAAAGSEPSALSATLARAVEAGLAPPAGSTAAGAGAPGAVGHPEP